MTKQQFVLAVCERLGDLPQSVIDGSLDYYCEMIDDRMEEGATEEEAVAAMGTPEDIASQILMETPLPKLVKVKKESSRGLRRWEMVLLVIGSPLWIILLLAAAMIFISVYAVLWSAIVVLYSADLCLAAGAVSGFSAFVLLLMSGWIAQGFLMLAAGLVCAGSAILLFFAFNKITRGAVKLSRWIVLWLKSLFVGKGDKK
ncbi:MAG: DUF1700 domain-containing protein [Clostridia bacterium]|nr:DUF1700 domain-containing protein [Clostridia bacterium]